MPLCSHLRAMVLRWARGLLAAPPTVLTVPTVLTMLTMLAMIGPACQCMQHDKRVPFLSPRSDPSANVVQERDPDGAVQDQDAQHSPDAALYAEGVSLAAETRRWEDQGAVIELPGGALRAALPLDLNADGQRDVLMVLQSTSNAPNISGALHLAWATRRAHQGEPSPQQQEQAFTPPQMLQPLTPPAGCSLDHASLQALPQQFATLSLEWRCPASAASAERAVEELVWIHLATLRTERPSASVITSWLSDPLPQSIQSMQSKQNTTGEPSASAAVRGVLGAVRTVVRPSLDVLAGTPRFRLQFEIGTPRLPAPVAVSLSWLQSPAQVTQVTQASQTAQASPWVLSTAELTGLVRGLAMKVSASPVSKRKAANAATVRAAWQGLGIYLAMCSEGGMATWKLASALSPGTTTTTTTTAPPQAGAPCHLAQPASELATAIVQREAARGDVHATMQAWLVLHYLGGYDSNLIDAALRSLPSMWPRAMVRRVAVSSEDGSQPTAPNEGLVRAMAESRNEVLPTPFGLVILSHPSAAQPQMKLQWLRPANWHDLPLRNKRAPTMIDSSLQGMQGNQVRFAIGAEQYVIDEVPPTSESPTQPPLPAMPSSTTSTTTSTTISGPAVP